MPEPQVICTVKAVIASPMPSRSAATGGSHGPGELVLHDDHLRISGVVDRGHPALLEPRRSGKPATEHHLHLPDPADAIDRQDAIEADIRPGFLLGGVAWSNVWYSGMLFTACYGAVRLVLRWVGQRQPAMSAIGTSAGGSTNC